MPPASGVITLFHIFSSATPLACSKVGHQDYFTVGNFATNAVLVVVVVEKMKKTNNLRTKIGCHILHIFQSPEETPVVFAAGCLLSAAQRTHPIKLVEESFAAIAMC